MGRTQPLEIAEPFAAELIRYPRRDPGPLDPPWCSLHLSGSQKGLLRVIPGPVDDDIRGIHESLDGVSPGSGGRLPGPDDAQDLGSPDR